MINYTVESKSKAIHHDNYIDDKDVAKSKCYTSCFLCAFCGKNPTIPVLKDKLLCAKYLTEVSNVIGKATCDSAKSSLKWYNFISLFKKKLAEDAGFDFKAR